MPEECACEVGVATQQHRQFIQSCQVLFQWDRNSHYWLLPFQLREVCLSWITLKNPRGKRSRLGSLADAEKSVCVLMLLCTCVMGTCVQVLAGFLFSHRIAQVEWKGTAHAPLPGLDPVARALHSSAEKCICLPELKQMKAALPGFSFASGPCFWKRQPCCFSLGLISGLRRIG